METFSFQNYKQYGIGQYFVQDNLSFSHEGVLRGLHFQNPNPQGKLVYVLQGEVFDVAVDIRLGSPTYGHWVSCILSSENRLQFWVPVGFAHGFCVMSKTALLAYKCTNHYHPGSERSINWNDEFLNIDWPVNTPNLSDKDSSAPTIRDIDQKYLHFSNT